MLPFSIDSLFALCAFIISISSFQRLRKTSLRLFPLFLFVILLIKIIQSLWLQETAWLYNASTTLCIIFYAYELSLLFRETTFRIMAHRFILIYPLLVVFNLIFIQGFNRLHSYTMVLGAIFIILFCALFFYELLQKPLDDTLLKNPNFWICTGILFFYLGHISYDVLFNLLPQYTHNTGWKLFISIDNNLNLMLYSCFIIAFLCKRTPRRSLQ